MIDWGFDEDDDGLPLLVICFCKWVIKAGRIKTRCGADISSSEVSLAANLLKYCPRCGKEISRHEN